MLGRDAAPAQPGHPSNHRSQSGPTRHPLDHDSSQATGARGESAPLAGAAPRPERRPLPARGGAPAGPAADQRLEGRPLPSRDGAPAGATRDPRLTARQGSENAPARAGEQPAGLRRGRGDLRLDAVTADARRAAASDPAVNTANDVSDLFGLASREAREVDAAVEARAESRTRPSDVAGSAERAAAASAHRAPVGRRTPADRRAPQRPDARPEAGPFSSKPAPRRSLRRTVTTRLASVVAMGFVAMLAVATSVPSLSLLTPEEVQAMALSQTAGTTALDGQRVDISGGTLAAGIGREDYQAQTIEEYAQAAGIRAEATFTNNPLGTVQWPFAVGVHIGDRFGYRNCYGCSSDHHGQDFNPGLGAQIQSIADGVVSGSTDSGGSLGVVTMIDHVIDGEVITSVYAHMEYGSRRFEVGDTVEVGDVVGTTGNTGMSTGPHLHFEIRIGGIDGYWVDPLEWLYANTN
ncbi:peptidoglycan DD-metalloendopeptidase family protein [Agromyces sp. GXS1127]|uniref:M23 family metallopeptidase n=1 Tax=Agromyces sp. GXS1127 TaxID=3424181 RepID=UPI003D321513